MIRRVMVLVALGAMLSAGTVYAQEEGEEVELVTYDPMVRVMDLPCANTAEAGCVMAHLPNANAPIAAIENKAYPYGTTFTVAPKVTLRVTFSETVFMTVRGPAVFTPKASDSWTKVAVEVQKGDFNFATGKRITADQFSITTPLGTFGSVQGLARLHVGEIADGTVAKDDFSFRLLEGSAVFKGLHYSMDALSKADTFRSIDAEGMTQSQIFGEVGEVEMNLMMSGDGKNLPFALTPGATVKITREKAPGSDNWTVAVLTLYANGEAQNYFCYVENRGEGFYTGELIAEIFESGDEEEEEEGAEGDSGYGSDSEDEMPEEMSDFGDLDLE